MITQRPSPNFDDRPAGVDVDMLVLHYTGMTSARTALDRLCDPAAKVSAHYVIDTDGTCWRLVGEDKRAWHAGVARWRGHHDINGRAIGIELVNPGHEFGYVPFAEAQIDALETLARDILSRHAIPARNVVGHADVAPTRKEDPGELFPWQRLARAGIGLRPAEAAPAPDDTIDNLLADIGYDITADAERTGAVLRAFQRHFRPRQCDGILDAETADLIARVHAALD